MYLRVYCSVHLKRNETNTTGLYGQNKTSGIWSDGPGTDNVAQGLQVENDCSIRIDGMPVCHCVSRAGASGCL